MRLARLAAVAALLLVPLCAFAQEGSSSTFVTGPLEWSPNLQLKDFGYDSNIYGTPVAPQWDLTGTLVPAVDAALNLAHIRATGLANGNLRYFERATNERSISTSMNGRVEFQLRRLVPSVSGSYANLRDVQPFEIDRSVRHHDTGATVGLGVYLGTRALVNAVLRQDTTAYAADALAHDVNLSTALDRRSRSGSLTLRLNVTPLTAVVADGTVSNDEYMGDRSKDQRTTRWDVGLDFAPDAVIQGHAAFGYHELAPVDPTVLPFKGYTSDVDLAYLLLSVTRFNGRYSHDTATSIEAPYYVQTSYGLDVEQQFIGPTSVLVRYNRQLADYDAIPERHITARVDRLDTYGGGLSIRLTSSTNLTVNYELAQRRSERDALSYDRERITTSVTMGF
jgi:hypothetical protein